MKLEHKRTLLRRLWLITLCLVVAGSLAPPTFPVLAAVGRLHISDKICHFVAYGVLSLLPVLIVTTRLRAVGTALSMELLGVALEYGQRLVPGRSFEPADVLANTLGVVCGTLLAMINRILYLE